MALTDNASTLNMLAKVAASELTSSQDISKVQTDLTSSSCSQGEASCTGKLSSLTGPAASLIALSMIQDESTISPIKYLEDLFAKFGVRLTGRRRSLSKADIPRPSFEEVEAYCQETALPVRTGDLTKLKELYYDKGFSLSACNRFGESLLHVCCRRGHAQMAEFMITEAKVNPRVIDDMGRTPFHDVCWSSEPNLETMDVLLKVLPPIGLMMQDCRGHTPLQYAPRKHWGVWLSFLQEREHIFVNWIRAKRERAALLRKSPPAPARVVDMNPPRSA